MTDDPVRIHARPADPVAAAVEAVEGQEAQIASCHCAGACRCDDCKAHNGEHDHPTPDATYECESGIDLCIPETIRLGVRIR